MWLEADRASSFVVDPSRSRLMVKLESDSASGAWLGSSCSEDGSVVCHSLVEVWSCDLGSEFLDLPKRVRTISLGMTGLRLTCEGPVSASSF